MSKLHYDAALRCSQFTGITRLVLLVLAYASTDNGHCSLTLQDIMVQTNCHRQPTISGALAELQEAGAITRPNSFRTEMLVDWSWLHAHAMTPAQLAEFDYTSRSKGRPGEAKPKRKTKAPDWTHLTPQEQAEAREEARKIREAEAEFQRLFPA